MVFFHHAPHANLFFWSDGLAGSFLESMYFFNWAGVDLFLCLSGFLITKLLLLEAERSGTFSISNFYVRRALRIWPLYFFMFVLAFLIFPFLNVLGPELGGPTYNEQFRWHFLPYLFFLGNWSTIFYGWTSSMALTALWTVSLEEQFYLSWPLILKTNLGSKRIITIVLFSALAFSLLMRLYLTLQKAPHPAIWVGTFTRLDPLVLGSLIALHFDQIRALCERRSTTIPLLLAGAFFFWSVNFSSGIGRGTYHDIWIYLFTALGSSCLLLTTFSRNFFSDFLSLPALVYLGKISYGLYCFHIIVDRYLRYGHGDWGSSLGLHPEGFLGWLSIVTVSFLATTALSVISYEFYEKHFLKLKTRFTAVSSRPV